MLGGFFMSYRLMKMKECYPEKLMKKGGINFPIYYRGKLTKKKKLHVAIIGSRRPTPYGVRVARWIASACVSEECIVVSGMAIGIDGIAMRQAIDTGGIVYGVLPCGVDVCYPKANSDIYHLIQERGCLISQYPLGMRPEKFRFIERNRLVALVADVIVVIEAGAISGTMHTVRFGLEYGVEIAAVPGEITTEVAKGCNKLLASGAYFIENVSDFQLFLRERKKFLDIE